MQPIMPVHRDTGGDAGRYERHERCVPTENSLEAVRDEHGVGHFETDKREEGADEHDHHAAIAELRPRLDHLRQTELGALRGVEGHEDRTEKYPQGARQRGVPKAQSHARADEADRNGKKMEIAQEPERRLINDAAVPLTLGDVVDRFLLDGHALEAAGALGRPPSPGRLCRGRRFLVNLINLGRKTKPPPAAAQAVRSCGCGLTLPQFPYCSIAGARMPVADGGSASTPTRQRILDEAVRLIAVKGVYGFTLRDIAEPL